MFFHFYNNIKNMDLKTLNYTTLSIQVRSTFKHRQYESNKVNNTATKHSLCPGNGVFAHEKCVIFETLYVFLFEKQQKHDIKNTKKTLKNKKNIKKHVF